MIKQLDNLGISSIMLTGDNYETAKNISSQVNIKCFKSNCVPEDKLNIIKGYQNSDKKIAVIGDSINDGPELKKANVVLQWAELEVILQLMLLILLL